MISQGFARRIASEWHGGQSTNLYSFASTGTIRDKVGLLQEVKDCHSYASAYERNRLNKLTEYLAHS